MDRVVTFRELVELKGWMLDHFVTKGEFNELKGEFNGLKGEFNELSDRVATGFDFLFGAFESLKQEQLFTHTALARIEAKLGI